MLDILPFVIGILFDHLCMVFAVQYVSFFSLASAFLLSLAKSLSQLQASQATLQLSFSLLNLGVGVQVKNG